MVPTDLRYTKDHEWVRVDGDEATIGITAYAADQLGDIVFVELPDAGRAARAVRGVRRRRIGQGRQRPVRAGRAARSSRRTATSAATRSSSTATRTAAAGCSGSRLADAAQLDALLDAGRLRRPDRRRLTDPMPYGPHTADDRERMLAALGLTSVDQLFEDIPVALRASHLDLPDPEPELELAARLTGLAARNRTDLASFLGAGVYRHWSPPAVDQLLLRGEWYTAYTPYQPEISQGTLQSIYEYESLLAELVDLDVVSASHYDGAAATAEAALMTCRATRRERVLISRGVHPHYRATTRTYFEGGLELEEIPLVADGDGGRDDRPRRARADAGRARPPGRRRHRRPARLPSNLSDYAGAAPGCQAEPGSRSPAPSNLHVVTRVAVAPALCVRQAEPSRPRATGLSSHPEGQAVIMAGYPVYQATAHGRGPGNGREAERDSGTLSGTSVD